MDSPDQRQESQWDHTTVDLIAPIGVYAPRHNGTSANAAPSADKGRFDTELVEDFGDGMVDQIRDGLGTDIEAGHRWKHHGTGLRDLGHQTQVAKMEWCLTDDQDKFAAFLQAHVGSAGNEICGVRIRNRAKGLDRTWGNRHPIRHKSAGRNRRTDVGFLVNDIGHVSHLVCRGFGLVIDCGGCALRNYYVGLNIGDLFQNLDESNSINGSAGSRNCNNDPLRKSLLGGASSLLTGSWDPDQPADPR